MYPFSYNKPDFTLGTVYRLVIKVNKKMVTTSASQENFSRQDTVWMIWLLLAWWTEQ